MTNQEIFLIDAFASAPFTGNPAGVCILDGHADLAWMQNIAMEMNQAETAFAYPTGDSYHLRWFTPTTEVELCGHATLACAHALNELGVSGPYLFDTLSGRLNVTEQNGLYTLDFPAEPVHPAPLKTRFDINSEIIFVGKNRLDWLIEVESEEVLRAYQPNLSQIADMGLRAVIITAKSCSAEYDFVSRLFGPNVGINEDPVTGSAHCALAPYWSKKLGKTKLTGYQASKRGGYVHCETVGPDRILMSGRAKTFLRGTIEK